MAEKWKWVGLVLAVTFLAVAGFTIITLGASLAPSKACAAAPCPSLS